MPVIIDTEICKGCELCVIYCPKKIIKKTHKLNKIGYNPVNVENPADCTSCGICYLMCPDYAIKIK
ncbi:MAG: hypothetical protein A2252_03875 [Elusimicrobia bacterium RIFOXYA2_FULL_39_19]|nr:MAG: hypothetical protein A2252_03875 [Elusimicrobia bacterium RIFOXYA2_FULL_39_19]